MRGREQTSQALPNSSPYMQVETDRRRGVVHNSRRVERTGIEAYAYSMIRYPVLSDTQNEVALSYASNHQSLAALKAHSLFAKPLEAERQALFATPSLYYGDPQRSYSQLFADSPTIGHLITFGNFPTIERLVCQYQANYSRLPVDYDNFLQDMLWKKLPSIAEHYIPFPGYNFRSLLKVVVDRKLSTLMDKTIRETSFMTGSEPGVRPRHQTTRVPIQYLHTRMDEESDQDGVELVETLKDTRSPIPGERVYEPVLAKLYQHVGITPQQAEAIALLVFDDLDQKEAARLLGISDRALRARRDVAFRQFAAFIQDVGADTFRDMLLGYQEIPQTPVKLAPHSSQEQTEIRQCFHCGSDFHLADTGRPRKYCSSNCRNAAFYLKKTRLELSEIMQEHSPVHGVVLTPA